MLHKLIKQSFATQSVYIVAGKRTPITTFLGKLSKCKATELGSTAIRGALSSINLDSKHVDEVIMGNVVSAGVGQAPARQASLGAGIPVHVPCTTVNKVCASGLKTIQFGNLAILTGYADCVVAGGMESMSNIPFYVTNHRKGFSFGDQTLLDGLSVDGLKDVYHNQAMGLCAEKTAQDLSITRQLQDDYAIRSYERTLKCAKSGILNWEITPVNLGEKEGICLEDDEPLRFKKEKMATLRPAFSKSGTITAANSSKIDDGACSLVLMSEKKVKETGVKPLGRIVSFADAEVDPIDFCIAPSKSSIKALERAGMKMQHIDFHEINEAFAVTVLANMKLLDIDIEKVNVHGGAVALGHPIGMSGNRIVLTLLNVLRLNKGKYGMAGICNGGGGASSIIIENLQ